MPVVLTGDVHHTSMQTRDQQFLTETEPTSALEYAEIVEEFDLSATLFLTGRVAAEDPVTCETLGAYSGIEVGGHNYFAYDAPLFGSLPYNAYRKIFGIDMPRRVNRWAIRKTRSRLGQQTGEPVRSWRDHGYRYDRNTLKLLGEEGVRYVSNDVTPDRNGPYESDDLVHVPINVLPDHEHLYHGYRTQEYVRDLQWENEFTSASYTADEWLKRVTDSVARIVEQGGTATILAHPACMSIVDGFDTFRRLCEFLSDYQTLQMRQL